MHKNTFVVEGVRILLTCGEGWYLTTARGYSPLYKASENTDVWCYCPDKNFHVSVTVFQDIDK